MWRYLNLNVLILLVYMHGAFVVQWFFGQGWRWVGDRGDGSFRKDFEIKWTVGGGSWKLDNFHGRHMCAVPKWKQECHQTKINQLYFYSATFIRFYSTQTWLHIYFEWSSIQEFVSKADLLAPISTVYSSVLLSLSKEKR